MKFPCPDCVSIQCGLLTLWYADDDERDLAYDWLEAYGGGEIAEPRVIKLLIWNAYRREGEFQEFDAETPFGTFYKIEIGLEGFYVRHDYNPSLGVFEGLEAAMAAAQQDYERRIRNAYGE